MRYVYAYCESTTLVVSKWLWVTHSRRHAHGLRGFSTYWFVFGTEHLALCQFETSCAVGAPLRMTTVKRRDALTIHCLCRLTHATPSNVPHRLALAPRPIPTSITDEVASDNHNKHEDHSNNKGCVHLFLLPCVRKLPF